MNRSAGTETATVPTAIAIQPPVPTVDRGRVVVVSMQTMLAVGRSRRHPLSYSDPGECPVETAVRTTGRRQHAGNHRWLSLSKPQDVRRHPGPYDGRGRRWSSSERQRAISRDHRDVRMHAGTHRWLSLSKPPSKPGSKQPRESREFSLWTRETRPRNCQCPLVESTHDQHPGRTSRTASRRPRDRRRGARVREGQPGHSDAGRGRPAPRGGDLGRTTPHRVHRGRRDLGRPRHRLPTPPGR